MKKIFTILIINCFIGCFQNVAQAQLWSSKAIFSPNNTTLFESASRFKYHHNSKSTYYMRYVDSAYYCTTIYYTVTTAPLSIKYCLPQDFVINEFEKFINYQGFVGSKDGIGMFGRCYNTYLTLNASFQLFKFSVVDQLNRIAVVKAPSANKMLSQLKAFAIGDKTPVKGPKQSYIFEFYAEGIDVFAPYHYAPLPIDPISDKQEIADDVITVDHYVIFATRDTRGGHAPVNLRISDTTDVLLNSDIDIQWQFQLPSYQIVCSELRLRYLMDNDFVLSYIIYDVTEQKYSLYIHKINLDDFLLENNTIVSNKIYIGDDCTNLVDIVYEPDVNTLMLLLNGNDHSKIYHADPYSTISTVVTKLDYSDGNLYSIDTIGDYSPLVSDRYVAMGGNRFFSQDITTGVDIDESCLDITVQKPELKNPPLIEKLKDPISRYYDNVIVVAIDRTGVPINGIKTCGINEDRIINPE